MAMELMLPNTVCLQFPPKGFRLHLEKWTNQNGQTRPAWTAFKARPAATASSFRKFYKGGFEREMTRREAALILGVRESTPQDKVKEAYRRVLVANHIPMLAAVITSPPKSVKQKI